MKTVTVKKNDLKKGRGVAIEIKKQSAKVIGSGSAFKSGSPCVELSLERDGIKKISASQLATAVEVANADDVGEFDEDGNFIFQCNVDFTIETLKEWEYKVSMEDEDEEEEEEEKEEEAEAPKKRVPRKRK